jgi:hypothetical protein
MKETILRYDVLLLKVQQLAVSNRPQNTITYGNFVRHKTLIISRMITLSTKKEDLITLRPSQDSA